MLREWECLVILEFVGFAKKYCYSCLCHSPGDMPADALIGRPRLDDLHPNAKCPEFISQRFRKALNRILARRGGGDQRHWGDANTRRHVDDCSRSAFAHVGCNGAVQPLPSPGVVMLL